MNCSEVTLPWPLSYEILRVEASNLDVRGVVLYGTLGAALEVVRIVSISPSGSIVSDEIVIESVSRGAPGPELAVFVVCFACRM